MFIALLYTHVQIVIGNIERPKGCTNNSLKFIYFKLCDQNMNLL